MKICRNCGTLNEVQRPECIMCGYNDFDFGDADQTVQSENVYDEADYATPERNGFVTFWLWFCIIVNVLAFFTNVFAEEFWGRGTVNSSNIGLYYGKAILDIVLIIGYISLLNWKKAGFWAYVLANAIICCIDAAELPSSLSVFAIPNLIISVGILYAVLHITKNGRSAWSYLS